MTFGKVLPSKARCFYDQKILERTFGEWKEQWTVCREKLSLRADNNYRHLLLNLIFKAWRAYVCQQQGKRNKYYVAESHAKKQTLLRTWQQWLVYVDVQRTKHGMQSVALAFRERSCLRISWAVWRRQHYQKCSGHKMNILALQHWAQSLQFRAWFQWRELYLYTQDEKQKDTRAVTHHQHWELRRCVGAWLGYLNLHRVKKRQNVTDVVLCVEEARQCELAEKHHKCHLLELGLKGLRQNVLDTRVQRMRTNLSSRQHQVTVLQKYWNRWKSRLEEKEEEQEQALTSVAHARYRRVLMRQVFDTWLLKVCKLQEYRMGEKKYVGHQREKWRKLVQADLHYRHVLLGKTLAAWKIYQQNIQCILYQVAEKEKQHTQLLLRQVLCTWRENVLALIHESKATTRADEHYRRAILSKVFDAWLRFAKGQQEKKDGIEKVTGVHHTTPLKEGVTRALRNTAGIKELQGQLHTQHQMEVKESEVPLQLTSVNKCPAQTGNLMLTPHVEERTCKCLSQMAEGEKREHSSREEKLERKVEAELRQIQQQMQYYYSRKQELKCCQQQAQILQQWLEMSTQPGAQDVRGVQEELGQLQVRISTLTKAQLAERQHVQALLARLREIQLALDL
ncbi:SFI1 centrin binding protein [Turdus rufiventris]|nr:SFI1 centrin binding protein [Turdus rufiventris]